MRPLLEKIFSKNLMIQHEEHTHGMCFDLEYLSYSDLNICDLEYLSYSDLNICDLRKKH